MQFSDLFDIQDKIAADLCAKQRYVLHCACGKSEEITEEQFSEYLAHGWPKHCGNTMALESVRVKEAS